MREGQDNGKIIFDCHCKSMEGEKLRNKKTAGVDRGISLFNLQLENPILAAWQTEPWELSSASN